MLAFLHRHTCKLVLMASDMLLLVETAVHPASHLLRLSLTYGNNHLSPCHALSRICLQVAAPSRVFIFDLLALEHHYAALNDCLHPCLSSPGVHKVGVGLQEDLRKLHASYRSVAAFQDVAGVLDLRSALALGSCAWMSVVLAVMCGPQYWQMHRQTYHSLCMTCCRLVATLLLKTQSQSYARIVCMAHMSHIG